MALMISEPAGTNPVTTDWQKEVSKVTKISAGFLCGNLTNMDNSNEPQVAQGTRFELNGSYYEVGANENISGWAGVAVGIAYVYAVPDSPITNCTFAYSATTPVYDSTKGGWFNGANRALFVCYKYSAVLWSMKRNMLRAGGACLADSIWISPTTPAGAVIGTTWMVP